MSRNALVALVLSAVFFIVSCGQSGDVPLDARTLQAGQSFSYQIQPLVESDEAATYSAMLADGRALPDWMAFDPETLTFNGVAPTDQGAGATKLEVRVLAKVGSETAVSGRFAVAVTAAAGSAPEIVNPFEELQEFSPTGILRWTEAAGATDYEVWVYSDPALSKMVEFSSTLMTRQYQFTKLAAGVKYYVKLYYRVAGSWRETATLAIQTSTRVFKPRLSNSQEELEGFSPTGTLRWSPVAGAETYEVWIYANAGLQGIAEVSGPVRDTQYRTTSLVPGATYYVQVYAFVEGAFYVGDPLAVRVTSDDARPRLVNPQEELDAFATNGILRWTAVSGATSYEAWIFTNPNVSVIQENSGPLSGQNYQTRTLAPGTTYYVQVFARVGDQWKVGAPVRVVTTGQVTKPRLVNSQAEIEAFATNGTLRWSEVAGATAYEIWIFANPGLGRVVEHSATNTTASYQIGRLCQGGTYYVQLFARVNGAWSSGSATALSVTQGSSPSDCVPPAPTVKLSAQPADLPSGGSTELTWTTRFASSCTASGGWSGSKGLSGQEKVGPLNSNRLFVLTCTGASGTAQGEAYVRAAPTKLSIADVAQFEGDDGRIMLNFSLRLDKVADQPVSVDYKTVAGSAESGVDFEPVSGRLTIPAGATLGTISVPAFGDTLVEPNETLQIKVSNPGQNVTLLQASALGTIVNDDPGLTVVSVAGASRVEGSGGISYLAFPVTLSRKPQGFVTFNYATVQGSASEGADYERQSGVFTLDGTAVSSGWISIPIAGDSAVEGNETFELKFSSPSPNAVMLAGSATGTIVDDDAEAGVVGITVSDVARPEGNSGTTEVPVRISLDHASVTPVSVDYVTVPVTTAGGDDFVVKTGRATIPAGATSATVSVSIPGDTVVEPDEAFEVRLSNASAGAAIIDDSAIITILNDDPALGFAAASVSDSTVSEGNSGYVEAVFTISLDKPLDVPVTFEVQTVPVTASPGTDFVSTSGALVIAAGQMTATTRVRVNGDTSVEPNETFELHVRARSGSAYVVDGVGAGTIVDDDGAPTALTTPGIWYGEFRDEASSLRMPAKVIVTNTGEARFLIQYRDDPAYSLGQFFGTVPTSVTQLSPVVTAVLYPDNSFVDGERVAPVTLSGSVTPLVSWSGRFTGGGDTGTFELAYQRGNFERWSSLEFVAGTYTGMQIHDEEVDPFGYGVKLEIGNNGVLSGSDTRGCLYSGVVSIVNPDRNYYGLTVSARNCAVQAGEYKGLAFFDLVGDGFTRLIFLANNGKSIWSGAVERRNPALIGVSVSDRIMAEGDSGSTAMMFKVSLERPTSEDVTVDYTMVPGTATPGVDYTGVTGALTIPAGATAGTITAAVIGDTLPESDEWFGVKLSNPSRNAYLLDAGAVGTITDDDTVIVPVTPGLWNGTVVDGVSGMQIPARVLVTPGGEIRFLLMPPGQTDPRYTWAQVFGTVPVSLTTFQANLKGVAYYDNYWSNGLRTTVFSLNSTVTPQTSWTGDFTETPGFGTLSWTYDKANFERASSLAGVAGSYRGIETHDTGYEYTVELSIASNGLVTGHDSRGCNYAGGIAVDDPTRNYYSLERIQISNCGPGSLQVNGAYSGRAYFDSANGGQWRLIYMTNLDGGSEIWAGAVMRQ